uniref:Putative glycine-rich cell wall structural protein 1 n=2 Tax=Rhipicephalus microplus TaxID=6941 RepID=A0A6G5A194_RHIMP|nr:glycine-rich cell wall structural protein 1-like [Rhipicephalus microplus]
MGPARTGLLILGIFVVYSSAQSFNLENELQFGRAPRVCRELYELGLAGVHPIHLGALTGGRKLQRSGVESSRVWTWLGNHGGRGLWGGTLGSHPWLSPADARHSGRWGVIRTGAWVIHGGRRLWIPLPMYGFGHTVDLSTGVRIDRRVTSGLKTGIPQGHVGPVGNIESMGPNFGPGLEEYWGFPGMVSRGGRRSRMGQAGPWGPVQGGPDGDEMFFSWDQNMRGGRPWGGMNEGTRRLAGAGGLGLGEGMGGGSTRGRQGSSNLGRREPSSGTNSDLDLGITTSSQGQQGAQGGASGTGGQSGGSSSAQGGTDAVSGSGLSEFSGRRGSLGFLGSGGSLGSSSGGSGLSGLGGLGQGGLGGMESLGGFRSWSIGGRRRRSRRPRFMSFERRGGSSGMGGLGLGGPNDFEDGSRSGGSLGSGSPSGGSFGFTGGPEGSRFGGSSMSGSGIGGIGGGLGSRGMLGEGGLYGGGEYGGVFGRGPQIGGRFGFRGSRWSQGADMPGSFRASSGGLLGQLGDEMGEGSFGFAGTSGPQFEDGAGYGGLYSGRRGIGTEGLGRGSGYGSLWSSQGSGSGSPFTWRIIRFGAPQHRRPSRRWMVWSSSPLQGDGGFNYEDFGGDSSGFFGGSGGGLSRNSGSSSFSDSSSGSSLLKL